MKRFKMLLLFVSALCLLLPAILFAMDWTQATANAGWNARYGHTSVVFNNKMWALGGYVGNGVFKNDVWYSSDGVNWTQATANAGWSARYEHTSVVFDNKIWVMGGWDGSNRKNDVWYSSDGVNWTQATANAGWSVRYMHTSVVFDNKIWVMGGDDTNNYRNDVWYSTDGVNWVQATANAGWSARYGLTSVVFDNKIWVLGGNDYNVGDRNDVWYSTDGMNWIQATANAGWSTRHSHASVVFDNKMWVMGGYASFTNDVWYSSDGANWTQATANAGWSARELHTSVVFDNKMWVMGGFPLTNDVWYSMGKGNMDWTQATANAGWSPRQFPTSVVFDNKMWVIGGTGNGGNRNDVWYSSNGINWTCATDNAIWGIRVGQASVVFNNKIWVMGGSASSGDGNDVWYSTDGVNWTRATAHAGWSRRYYHTSVVFDNKIWVIGGINMDSGTYTNDVWYSTDGINWTQATAHAGWSARYEHTSVVFDNKIWVMGGGYPNLNDVWYSSNGVNWTQATANAGWSARSGHTSVVFDNKMWVMGGTGGGFNFRNDVWYSTDGVNWTQATAHAGWSTRYFYTSVVFDNKMWVMGGCSYPNYFNDVWYSRGIFLVSPNGNESWASGTNQIIKWRTSWWCLGFARYRLLLSRDGGSNYTDTIAYNVASTESTYNWFVPVVKSAACRIMVQALELTGSVAVQGASDANFTIHTADVSVDSIIQPADSVVNRTLFYPIILVGNNSFPTTIETCTLSVKIWRFRVKYDSFCNISVNPLDSVIVYDTFKIFTINPGQTRESMPAWRPVYGDLYWLSSPTYHTIRASIRMAGDMILSNDSKRKKFIVKPRKYDLQVNYVALLRGRVLAPDTISVGIAYNTAAVISNSPAGPTAGFRLWCKVIKVKTNISWYSQYVDRTLNPKTYACISTSSGWVPSDTGLYRFYCYIEMRPGVDSTPENNTLERLYYVRRQPPTPPQGAVSALPQVFRLMQNNPNPFHGVTSIRWQIPVESRVLISIYDATGRIIKTLVNDNFNTGYYNTTWDCTNDNNQKVVAGVYFLRYTDNTNQKEIKLIVQ